MKKLFIRKCVGGVNTKGKMVELTPTVYEEIHNELSPEEEAYTSVFYFNEEQFEEFNKTGTVAGITNVVTDKLVFDFDDRLNPQNALDDSRTLYTRLISEGFKDETIGNFYSGNKGVHTTVKLTEMLTPEEVRNICTGLAGDLKTFDHSIYNATRIFREPLTKNKKGGRYKVPLTYDELFNNNIEQIMKLAEENLDYSAIKDYWQTQQLPPRLREIKNKTPQVKINEKKIASLDISTLDRDSLPKGWDLVRWALLNGYFGEGSRSSAFLCLAAYLSKLFPIDITYRMLKGTAELQAQRTGGERFPDNELYNNIIMQVYGPNWKGGIYSLTDPNSWLYCYGKEMGLLEEATATVSKDILTTEQVGELFKSFATNIDKNRIKIGIKELDETLDMLVGRVYVIAGSAGSGKCHGKGTKVLMYDGTTKCVEDVVVGDQLMGDDSTPRNVLSLATGREMLYKIKQKNGNDYVVNESHILSLKGNSSDEKCSWGHNKVVDISLTDYLNRSVDFRRKFKGYKVPLSFSKKELGLDPYILGLWLGDGTTAKPEFTIAKTDTEILDYINQWGDQQRLNVEQKQYPGSSDKIFTVKVSNNWKGNGFLSFLRDKKLTDGKYIPHEFLTSAKEDRLQLLAGLLDTDGFYDKNKNTFEFSCSIEEMIDQVMFLSRGLGFKVTKSSAMKHYRSFTKGKLYEGDSLSHRLYITGDNLNEIPTKVSRKKAYFQDKQRYQDLTEISVVKLEEGDYFGFELDGNHRYLLDDLTVTHNTSLLFQIFEGLSSQGNKAIFFSYDMSLQDCFQKVIQKEFKITAKDVYEQYKDPKRAAEFHRVFNEKYGNVIFINSSGMTVESMRDRITQAEKTYGEIKVVAVDYMTLTQSEKGDSNEHSKSVIQGLKAISTDMRKCVISLNQPNKANQKINEPLSGYGGIQGSSAVQELANAILWVYRVGANPTTFDKDKYYSIECMKNRHGPLFSVDLGWSGITGTVYSLTPAQQSDLARFRQELKEEKAGKNDNAF